MLLAAALARRKEAGRRRRKERERLTKANETCFASCLAQSGMQKNDTCTENCSATVGAALAALSPRRRQRSLKNVTSAGSGDGAAVCHPIARQGGANGRQLRCGASFGHRTCPRTHPCCSASSWCGSSKGHCGKGKQDEYSNENNACGLGDGLGGGGGGGGRGQRGGSGLRSWLKNGMTDSYSSSGVATSAEADSFAAELMRVRADNRRLHREVSLLRTALEMERWERANANASGFVNFGLHEHLGNYRTNIIADATKGARNKLAFHARAASYARAREAAATRAIYVVPARRSTAGKEELKKLAAITRARLKE